MKRWIYLITVGYKRLARWIFASYCGLISYLAFIPSPQNLNTVSDKIKHFLAFLVFVFLGYYPLNGNSRLIFLGALVFGIFIEVVQFFLPYRSAEAADLLADLLGTLAGILVCFFFLHGGGATPERLY